MRRMKFIGIGFIVAIVLAGINSCGVPAPLTPEVDAVEPVAGSTIASTDSIIVLFSTSMTPGTLKLAGDMVNESDRGVWFQNKSANDTLVIRPNVANGGIWSAGLHGLTIDVEATSGVAVQPLVLNYEIIATVPTVIDLSPASTSKIIGSSPIVIVFSVEMDPSTLVLSGDMAAVSNAGVWSNTINTNDTLVISSSSAWNNLTDNLIINVDSIEGAPLSPLSLFYMVDVEVPTVTSVIPASTSAIQGSTPIVISFSLSMDTSSLAIAGSMWDDDLTGFWSSNVNAFDTLTLNPIGVWSDGNSRTLIIDANAFNGFAVATESLSYDVDDTLAIPAETPASGSLITSGEKIVIDFGEEMDIGSIVASGSLWDNGDGGVWSASNNILSILPATLWPAGPIFLTLDIVDLVGNSIIPLNLNYTVDVVSPTTSDVTPATTSNIYNLNASAVADTIVITFSEQMAPATLVLGGDLGATTDSNVWSRTTVDDDTLTLTTLPSTDWPIGSLQSLTVNIEDVAGNPLIINLEYNVFELLCGDGDVTVPEECDDAGESATCNDICTFASCGDGVTNVTASEVCDDAGESASCDTDCTNASCGDGTLNITAGEACDDAGESASCDTDCTNASCGDGTLNATAGETCDDAGESASCDTDCTNASCGDGTLNITAGETCDDAGESASCDTDCTGASCGDGVTNTTAGEACDDAGESATCNDICTIATCGDGITNVTALEQCDDSGESATCTDVCTVSACGDGIINAAAFEQCDDGNLINGDGCDDMCVTE